MSQIISFVSSLYRACCEDYWGELIPIVSETHQQDVEEQQCPELLRVVRARAPQWGDMLAVLNGYIRLYRGRNFIDWKVRTKRAFGQPVDYTLQHVAHTHQGALVSGQFARLCRPFNQLCENIQQWSLFLPSADNAPQTDKSEVNVASRGHPRIFFHETSARRRRGTNLAVKACEVSDMFRYVSARLTSGKHGISAPRPRYYDSYI